VNSGVRVALIVVLQSVAFGCHSGPQGLAELETLRSEKLARPVFKRASWCTEFDGAREMARVAGKPLFAYFTRSYEG
jgi:hypothetical protein